MLTKASFLAATDCLTKGWHYRMGVPVLPQPSYSQEAIIQEGIKIGEMARTLFSDGILINEGSNILNYKKTLQLIANAGNITLFEATFIYQNAVARADILQRIHGEWFLFEVKSSVTSDQVKDEEIDDATYTGMILDLCGIQAKTISLMRVSKDYRLGMDNRTFFSVTDCTEAVQERLLNFRCKFDSIMDATGRSNKPTPTLIMPCKQCDFFENHCVGKGVPDPLFDLSRISSKKFNEFVANGIYRISMIPAHHILTSSQEIIWQTVKNQRPWCDLNKITEHLNKIVEPVYYLDFETVSTAIPLYPDITPYETIVTQYSIHQYTALWKELAHCEFLAEQHIDDRRRLTERLLDDIGTTGSVIVYHAAAEKRFILSLVDIFPDLANRLLAIIDRIIDLKIIVQDSYYHQDLHGSYSIKAVLPIFVPDMNYNELDIGDGLTASAVFANLARGKYPPDEAVIYRNNLMEYCKQDTFAMVRIHQKLAELVV